MRTKSWKKWAIGIMGILFAVFVVIGVKTFTASAEEPFVPDVTVGTEQELKQAVLDATSGVNKKIQLTQDIALNDGELSVSGGKNITLDLNGHKLSRANGGWVIVLWENTTLTLKDIKGGGVITNDKQLSGQPLIYNYGTLITSVDITVPAEDTYGSFTGGNNPTITSVSRSEFATNNTTKPSVTVLGGTLTGPTQGAIINLFDSDLTVTGGTFVPNSSPSSDTSIQRIFSIKTLTINAQAGISDLAEAIKNAQADLATYKDYRGCTVKVTGGDFTAFTPQHGDMEIDSKIYVGYERYSGIPGYFVDGETGETANFNISLEEGSKWGKDLSAYTPEGKWMELYDPSIDEGTGAKKYYIVSEASGETAGATVTVGESTRYYADFASAWGAIGTTTEDRTLKLCNDAKVEQLDFSEMSGNITLDLNGKKLTIERSNSMSSGHLYFGSSRNALVSLTVKDSLESGGEIILDTPSGGTINTNSFIYIKNYAKFILESGTIRQTGYFPANYKTTTNASNRAAQAIFHLSPDVEAQDVVTIKGGNIISDIYYGTDQEHGELTSSPYFVSWEVQVFSRYELNFEEGEKYTNKTNIFKFDLADYIEANKTDIFSWNFKDEGEGAAQWAALEDVFQSFTLSSYGKDYMFSNFTEDDKFLASDGNRYETLQGAVNAKKGDNFSITVLKDNLTIDEAVTLDGITLDLDRNKNFTLTIGDGTTLTLTGGATLRNGKLSGNVTVAEDATMRDVTVTGNVAVQSGTLTIPSGTYQGAFTFAEGANAVITGGWFKGNQIETLDQYFAKTYGAYITAGEEYVDNTLYEVKVAPNLDAQKWYNANKTKEGGFEIASTDDWNAFAIYVSSGADNFSNKTVKLTQDLDFGYVPPVNGVSAASEPLTFYPAGNQKNQFLGTFDGGNHTIEGIYVTEINAGLFGGTNGPAKIHNLTVANSMFIGGSGVGYFDEFNTEKGWVFVGGVVAQGNLGHTSEADAATGIKVQNVMLSQKEPGTIMGGGFIGQTWSTLYLQGIEVDNVTLDGGWKMGGIVGFTEAPVFIMNGSVKNVECARDCTYFGSVMGQLVGNALTLDGCAVDASDSYLVGGMDAGSEKKDVSIKGTGTDITTKGVTGTTGTTHGPHEVELEITVPTTNEESQKQDGFTLDFKEEEIPNDAYKFDGDQVVVRGAGTAENEVTKLVTELNATDEGKVIAGQFKEAIDEKYIAPGYAYMKDDSSQKYVVCEMVEYYPLLLSGESAEGAEMSLAEYRDHLLNTYEYSEEAEAKINAIYTRIAEELEEKASELTMTEVRKLINSAKAEMDAVPILSAEEAQKAAELEQAKKDAKNDLQLYAASNGVSLSDESVTDGLAAIGDAETTEDVTAELNAAKAAVDEVKKAADDAAKAEADKQAAAAALAEAKKNAKNDLQLYAASNGVSLSDKSVTDGLKAIDEATSEQTVASALTTAKAAVDAAKKAADDAAKEETDKQAAAAALAEAKKNAKNDLQLYAASNGVALSDKSVSDGLKAIEDATDEQKVSEALTTAKAAVDAAKKAADDAAKAEAALAETKKNAKNDLQLYAASNGVALSDKSVTDGLKAIDEATSEQSVTSALTDAKGKVDAAKTAADDAAKAEADKQSAAAALAEAKKNAKNDLQLYAASNGVALNDKSVTDGLKAIDEAADEQKVSEALTSAKAAVDAVKKAADDAAKAEADKQAAAAALAEAKKNAKNDLQLYAASNGVALSDKSVADGLKAIDEATSEQSVTSALTAAKGKVDAAKAALDMAAENAEKEAAAAAALAEAKKNAKNDLQLYAASNGVALSDKSVTDGLKAIDEATSEQTVTSALTTAKDKVDAAKKAADDAAKAADDAAKAEAEKQAAAAALAEAKKNAKNDLQLYAASNGVALSDKSVADGLKAIDEATSEQTVTSALTAAKGKVDAAKAALDMAAENAEKEAAAAAALAEAKKNAKNGLQLYAASNGVALSDKSVTDGLKAIDDAADEQKASAALTTAKAAVDEAKKAADDAAKAADEAAKAEAEKQAAAAALAEAKKNAETELKLHAASKGVSLDDETVKDGLSKIESASDESGVATALTAAEKNVDAAVATQSSGPSGWEIALITISAVEILVIAALIVVCVIKKKKKG